MLHWWQWYIKCCQLILFFILLKGRFPSHIRMLLKDQVPSHIREAIHSRADTAEASNSSLISVTFLGTLSVLDLENLPQEHGGLMTCWVAQMQLHLTQWPECRWRYFLLSKMPDCQWLMITTYLLSRKVTLGLAWALSLLRCCRTEGLPQCQDSDDYASAS